ncbi:TPA: hypothetical protein G9F27_002141 [Salmonella enterica]|uniref:Secreted protein n=1 Tax=Salmonella enterica TaxID=28901 RepID=A0A743SPX8_SALER|nr:hypothetical protein [Salmonella enterica]
MLITPRILLLCVFFFAGHVSADCGQKESIFSCFIGKSLNPVHLGSDGLYHTDYYCSDMVSSYYSPDNKGNYSGEWHYNGSSDTKDCKYYRELDRLSIQSQIENCIHWKNNNIQVPEKYHCDQLLKDY